MKSFHKEIIIFFLFIVLTVLVSVFIIKMINKNSIIKENKNSFSIELEKKLKKIIKKQIEYDFRIINNDNILDDLNIIKDYLIENIEDNTFDVEIILVESSVVNALTFPGGLIVLYSGLIKSSSNPEEIASVLAHELGHVNARDSVKMLIRQFGIAVLFSIITGSDATVLDNIIRNLIGNAFTREQERRADDFAIGLLVKSGINPVYFSDFFKRLQEREDEIVDKKILKYIGTHPLLDERIEKAEKSYDGSLDYKFDIDWEELKRALPSYFE